LKFRESKFALNHLFDISKPLWIFILHSIGLGCVNNTLVSSANNKEVDLLLTILRKSFIYNRNAVVPRWNLVAHCVKFTPFREYSAIILLSIYWYSDICY